MPISDDEDIIEDGRGGSAGGNTDGRGGGEEEEEETIEYDPGRNLYEVIDDIDMENLRLAGTLDAVGNQLGTVSSGGATGDPYSANGLKVIGMPFFYSPNDDRGGRVFSKTFESDLPLVFILPGNPRINQRLFGTADEGGWFDFGGFFNRVGTAASNVMEGIITGKTGWRDGRWMSFHEDVEGYKSHLNTLVENTRAAMGLSDGSVIVDRLLSRFINGSGESISSAQGYGYAFYATKGTDINESANNEYSLSDVGREANDKQASIRERKMLASVGGGSIADKAAHWISELAKQVADLPVVGGLVGALTENLDGAMLYYPDVWNNSTFDRTYSLEFKFTSPYGDARSIFNYVYVPFLMLLAMSLPKQDGYYSYKQPFILRISAPGHFECDMGVVRSMSIDRGGDGMWSAEHLPREITVRMMVTDLYPNLVLSPSDERYQYNYGLMSYIDALAGIRYDQLSAISPGDGRISYDVGGDRTSSLLAFRASGNYEDINSFFNGSFWH